MLLHERGGIDFSCATKRSFLSLGHTAASAPRKKKLNKPCEDGGREAAMVEVGREEGQVTSEYLIFVSSCCTP
jgi:hypothetical protein